MTNTLTIHRFLLRLFLVTGLLGCSFIVKGQLKTVIVDEIILEGNRRTKEALILREMDFKKGDQLPFEEITTRLKQNQQLVLNMGIFNSATVNISDWKNDRIIVKVNVVESWYVFPIPLLELADRNFNVWWVEQGRKLNRINFGFYFYWKNFTGHNDLLKVSSQWGYINKYQISYDRPFFANSKNWGFNFKFFYKQQREVAYTTENNKRFFYINLEAPRPLMQRFYGHVGLSYRKGYRVNHYLNLQFGQVRIDTSIARLNPDYLLRGQLQQLSPMLSYTFRFDTRDVRPYPTSGQILQANILKEGLGIIKHIDQLTLGVSYGHYLNWHKRWHVSLFGKGKFAFNKKKQPYYNTVALGFDDDYVRGYQYYVVNGLDYVYQQSDLHFKVLDLTFDWRYVPIESLRYMPLRIYLRYHNDFGYVWDEHYDIINPLSNKLLWGTGLGIDIVLYYDKIFQIDYSINQLGEKGLYLRTKIVF